MKKLIPLFLSTVMLAGFARCEGASDFSQVGNLSANSIMANTINGGSIQLPYSLKYVAGAYTIPAATTYKTNTELNSAGVWTTTVITNTVASHTSTNMIRADRFLGKAGLAPMPAWREQPVKSLPKKKAQERAKAAAAG